MAASRPNADLSALKESCEQCSLAELCLPRSLSAEEIRRLDEIVRRGRPLQRAAHLYRMNEPGHALYLVRTGSLKTYLSTDGGDEQIVGFHLPGELVGLDAFERGRHSCSAVALETTTVCELPGDSLDDICRTVPALHHQLQRMIGKEISSDHTMLLLLGKKNAEERLATFLVSLSSRFSKRGFSATEFNLSMSRQDVGSYLGLAVETISRLFAHFHEEGILNVDRRFIEIRDMQRLKSFVSSSVFD